MGRRVEHAEHRPAGLDQRDVDGEFVGPRDELPGPVERIDEPEAAAGGCRWREGVRALLRDHGDARVGGAQTRDDEAIRRPVRLGYRRAIVLRLDRRAVAVEGHDCPPGLQRQMPGRSR